MKKQDRPRRKEPLYRRVNTLARGVYHRFGGDYSQSRHRKPDRSATLGSMRKGVRRGLDYTPLFRFLLSKVGQDWDAVHSEAVSRLDRAEPIFWLVALREGDKEAIVNFGESTYYSGLYVDENNVLAIVDPSLTVEQLAPRCSCCSHTFNGVPFTKAYSPTLRGVPL